MNILTLTPNIPVPTGGAGFAAQNNLTYVNNQPALTPTGAANSAAIAMSNAGVLTISIVGGGNFAAATANNVSGVLPFHFTYVGTAIPAVVVSTP